MTDGEARDYLRRIERAGMNIGDKITVQVHQGWLTIVKVITIN